MNAWEQRKSETCASESGCATSVDISSSEEKKQQESTDSNVRSMRGTSAAAASTKSKGPWSYREHGAFLHGIYVYGKDWKHIAALVKSRNAEEVQRHFVSFQQEEPFLFTLKRMLDDFALDHIIAWLPDGRSFRIYNKLMFMRVALPLYFGTCFRNLDHFQKELYSYEFNHAHNGVWFHANFWRDSSLQKMNNGIWSTIEHCLFLEGLERYGRSWQDIASNVKTRTKEQVCKHGRNYLKKIDCYWTTKEHQLFLEGLEQFGIGGWEEIGSHIGTKNNKQVSFHAKEYFEEMNEETQKMMGGCEDPSSDYEETSQSKENTIINSCEAKRTAEEEITTNSRKWSAEEHRRFMEGLERHGRSWKYIASHVKTKTAQQVGGYAATYFKKIDCYWTNNEHLLFLEGLEQYGRGRWEKIASHIKSKNNEQVAFHAKEYYEEMRLNEKSEKTADSSEGRCTSSVREVVNKPNSTLFPFDGSNAKRSRDQEDTARQRSKKLKTSEANRKNNNEQIFVTPEKERLMNSTNNLKSFQNVNEGTYNNSEKDKNGIRPVGHKPKKSTADPITTDVNNETSCPICLEKLNDPHIVPECCHRFCKGCIEEALEYRRECPICRGRVTSRRALRRDEVFSKLVHLLDVERAKANTNSVSTIDDVDQLSNDAVASDNHQTETMEKNERIYVSTGAQNKEQADVAKTAASIHPALGSIDEEPMAEVDISFVKTPLDAINVVESTQKVCVEEKEETLGQTKDDDDVMNENNEAKLQGNAIKDQLQHINKERKYLEIQLEKKNNKIRAIDKVVRNLSDEHKIESMAAAVNDLQSQLQQKNHSIYGLQTQLQQKNYRLYNLHSKLQQNYHRIQHLESRGKADKENSRCVSKTIEDLVTEVEEKKTRISALEKLLRTLSDVHKIESMAAAAREVESQLQEKNDRVQQLESRQKEDEDRLWHVSKANEQLEKQLEEKNLRINYLQTLLEEKNDRIQDLELRGKADEEKLQCLNKTSEHLETQLEEKNTRIDVLEELARTLGDEHEIESMAAAVKDLQSQLQEKNDRIQLLESRKQKVEVIEEEKTIDLPLDFDINDMPGQAAGNETKRGSIHSKP
ncbi:predicted protein [Chaetoceros tenuissimus]|uniref:RING-type E3 ubiquitin transferase n=1 Tax=Chaetoceros tenuissimus TaxID=426638 RepID=A0AAD3H252_9STRA|nr:predicted protein [Chaetoceros tenuissimus]